MKRHGRKAMGRMASSGWKTTKDRYGSDGYRLMRYGFKIKSLLPVGSPAWEKALNDIESGRVKRKRKRSKAEIEAVRAVTAAEDALLRRYGFDPGFMTDEERVKTLVEIRAGGVVGADDNGGRS